MLDPGETCRTCTKRGAPLLSLQEPCPDHFDDKHFLGLPLAEVLMECIDSRISEKDGLPQGICEECLGLVRVAFTFRRQAAEAERRLRDLESLLDEVDVDGSLDCARSCVGIAPSPSHQNGGLKTECDDDYTDEMKLDIELEPIKEEVDDTLYVEVFRCKKCPETFESKKDLTAHTKTYHGLECRDCGKVFAKKSLLEKHLKRHNALVCSECGASCGSKRALAAHRRRAHDVTPHQCAVCGKQYDRADLYREHMRRHEGVKPNVCPYCNKGFSQLCNLKDHLRTHTGETPYLCAECGRGFNNSSNLRQHVLRHKGLKQHACQLCPKTFATKAQMKNHLATHSGEHPHTCDTCGAAFTKPQSLKKHSLIHLGVKPHQCDACPMRFTDRNHLKRHQRTHTGEKPYSCSFCARAFTQSNDLAKHLRTHLGKNIYRCTVCGAGFRLQSELKLHYPSHYIPSDGAAPATLAPPAPVQPSVQENPVPAATLPLPEAPLSDQQALLKIQTILSNKENGEPRSIILTINRDQLNKAPQYAAVSMLPGES